MVSNYVLSLYSNGISEREDEKEGKLEEERKAKGLSFSLKYITPFTFQCISNVPQLIGKNRGVFLPNSISSFSSYRSSSTTSISFIYTPIAPFTFTNTHTHTQFFPLLLPIAFHTSKRIPFLPYQSSHSFLAYLPHLLSKRMNGLNLSIIKEDGVWLGSHLVYT